MCIKDLCEENHKNFTEKQKSHQRRLKWMERLSCFSVERFNSVKMWPFSPSWNTLFSWHLCYNFPLYLFLPYACSFSVSFSGFSFSQEPLKDLFLNYLLFCTYIYPKWTRLLLWFQILSICWWFHPWLLPLLTAGVICPTTYLTLSDWSIELQK